MGGSAIEGEITEDQRQQPQLLLLSSSIVGMQPGQTPFSPPAEKTGRSPASANPSTSPSIDRTTARRSGGRNSAAAAMPLVMPFPARDAPSPRPPSPSERDNRDSAHARPPSLSSLAMDAIDEGEEGEYDDNALRRHLLREGIIPPPLPTSCPLLHRPPSLLSHPGLSARPGSWPCSRGKYSELSSH